MRTFGLIPAAGKSQRMGRPKLLLPLGDATVLERVISAVRVGGVHEVVVVAAPDAEALSQLASKAGAHLVRLKEDTPEMKASCLCGLAWIEEHFQPKEDDGWLLLPADHPTVNTEVVRAVLAARQESPEATIIVPTHQGRRGHPTWLRWSHVAGVRQLEAGVGLNGYIRQQAGQTCELPWPSAEVLRDLDTPEDYRHLIESIREVSSSEQREKDQE
jgi:molybdenum cofactor cytidylyltransferase